MIRGRIDTSARKLSVKRTQNVLEIWCEEQFVMSFDSQEFFSDTFMLTETLTSVKLGSSMNNLFLEASVTRDTNCLRFDSKDKPELWIEIDMTCYACALCNQYIQGYGNNGAPLIDGIVCDTCNVKVIVCRLTQALSQDC